MSKIALTPNASGTGTFTLAAPNSNTSRTITLPDEAGEVLVNGTNQNVGIGTSSPTTKLQSKGGSISTPTDNAGLIANASASFVVDHANDYGLYTGYVASANDAIGIAATRTLGSALPLSLQPFGGNVGIGTSSPNVQLKLEHANRPSVALKDLSTNDELYMTVENDIAEFNAYTAGTGARVPIVFTQYTDERMRIDSSGRLLVGGITTLPSSSVNGFGVLPTGIVVSSVANDKVTVFNRNGSDGEISLFQKNGSTVGSISSRAGIILQIGSNTLSGLDFGSSMNPMYAGSVVDNTVDLGYSGGRFDDIYATNGTIQTSDRNEKQDIEVLSDAETRVAQACKGLLRKFRWQDAVAKKGDDARIHFGIIAQDLQDAFAAEGLDAGRYAMFISSTWWETQTEVPAVEAVDAVYEDVVIPAVLDEEGNELEAERTEQQLVTEAVEAKDAYTRTDTYETQEEAPEGATERTRLGVRYPELLAFIIGAM